jgi:hypothetical protein
MMSPMTSTLLALLTLATMTGAALGNERTYYDFYNGKRKPPFKPY